MAAAPAGQRYKPTTIKPDARAAGFIGFLRAMVRNPVSAIPASAYEEPLVVLSFGGTRVGFVCDPALTEEVLIKRPQDFPKSVVDERIFEPAFGNSLLIAHGEDWRWKRRLAAPYFSPAALVQSVPSMTAPFVALASAWNSRNSTEPIDVSAAMTKATLEVINSTLFTNQDEVDIGAVSQAITDYLTPISWTIGLASLKAPAWLPHPGKGQIRRGQAQMRRLVGEVISGRCGAAVAYDDICADLMNARDPETGRPLSHDDLVDMLLTLVAAGHETSANALTWALYCLAEQPHVQEELRAEVGSVVAKRQVEAPDLAALVKVEAFIKETMRLFPPAPLLARRTTKTEKLDGCELQRGVTLFIPVYAIHRHKQLWSLPDCFDLSHFLGEEATRIQRTAYLPFGAGPRVCIGGTFAMMEMVGALATLLQRLRFSVISETRCEPIQRITLRPMHSLQLAVQPV
jgi:cytochrome P450